MRNKMIFPDTVKCKDGFHFRNMFGKLSRDVFFQVREYSDGFAPVKIEKGGLWFYRNLLGEVGDTGFEYLLDYYDGIGIGRLPNERKFHFIDHSGKVSEDSYDVVTYYSCGFSKVQNFSSTKIFYRDMLGNVTRKSTYLGKRVYSYYSDQANVIDYKALLRDARLPYDEKLGEFVMNNERYKILLRYYPQLIKREISDYDKAMIQKRLSDVEKEIKSYKAVHLDGENSTEQKENALSK